MESLLTVTVAATNTMLATVDDLKGELGLETSDNSQLFRYLRTASQQIAQYLNRFLPQETVSETFRREFHYSGTSALNLTRYPVGTIISVTEDGTVLTANTDFECDKTKGQLFRLSSDRRCNWCAAKVVVVYQGGYVLAPASGANLPADIETAAIRLASQLYGSREREQGLRSEIVPGVIERQYWDQSASGEDADEISPDIRALLDPYRCPVIV